MGSFCIFAHVRIIEAQLLDATQRVPESTKGTTWACTRLIRLSETALRVPAQVINRVQRGIESYVNKASLSIIVTLAHSPPPPHLPNMAKPMPIDQQEPNGQALPPNQTGIVEEFVRILSHLSGDKGCQGITSLVCEMDGLRARNRELETEMERRKIAETSNFAAIQKVMNDKQELDQRCSQKDADLKRSQSQAREAEDKLRLAEEKVVALEKELKSTNEEIQKAMVSGKKQELLISGLNGSIAKLQESAKQAGKDLQIAHVERTQAKKQCDVVSQELQAFKQRAFPLQPTSDSALCEQ